MGQAETVWWEEARAPCTPGRILCGGREARAPCTPGRILLAAGRDRVRHTGSQSQQVQGHPQTGHAQNPVTMCCGLCDTTSQ